MEFLLSPLLPSLIILRDFLPQLYQSLNRFFFRLFPDPAVSSQSITSITIYEFDAFNNSELYDSVHSYLVSKCFPSTPTVKFSKPKNSNSPTFTIGSDQEIQDTFHGMRVKWSLRPDKRKYKILGYVYRCHKIRYFELSFQAHDQSALTLPAPRNGGSC